MAGCSGCSFPQLHGGRSKEQTEFYERALRLVENERDLQLITQREGGGPLLRGRELSVALERELTRDALR
jgi:hypothetical protein